jgi:hypothetical protein
MNESLPTPTEAKTRAKALRKQLADKGVKVGHARSLELVAQGLGYRDWNTLSSKIRTPAPQDWVAGSRVCGRYLSHPFNATIVDATQLRPGWFQIKLDLDEAIDVVTFDSFSNYRKRIKGVIGPKGHTEECTSNGVPHLEIDL